jgi:hypothetical protein
MCKINTTSSSIGRYVPYWTPQLEERRSLVYFIHHQPINVPTAGVPGFLMDYTLGEYLQGKSILLSLCKDVYKGQTTFTFIIYKY